MECYISGGGKAEQLPFNALRYARDNDKLLYEFADAYMLDREFAVPGFTILRPSDEVLKKLVGEMEKVGAGPPDPKFVTQQEKGMMYILKGAISPGILHASHWYVSEGRRAYAVYMADTKICLRDSETDDPKKQMDGAIAELVMVMQNGSSIYKLKGELPKGADPIRPPPTRNPMASPLEGGLDAVRMVEGGHRANSIFLGGGGMEAREVGCLPCEMGGGALAPQSRYSLMMTLRDGDESVGLPGFKDGWAPFFVTSLCQFIFEGVCKDADAGLSEAVKALLTGNPVVDALLLLEPMAESPLRQGEAVPPTHRYLIPDPVIAQWTQWLRGSVQMVQEQALAYRGKLAEMMNQGASAEFTAARTAYVEHMRHDLAKIGPDAPEKARLAFIRGSVDEIKKLYSSLSARNEFSANGSSPAKAFTDPAYEYLSKRYGDRLAWYLPWTMLVFFYCEAIKGSALDKFEHLAQMAPGREFETEVQGALTGAGLEAGFYTAAGLIQGGFLGYLRASLDGLSAVGVRKNERGLVIGGGFSHIDTAYRAFDRSVRRATPPDRAAEQQLAGELEEMAAIKKKRKELKKKMKKLAKKRWRALPDGDEETDEEGEKERLIELSAVKKKLKRNSLRKKIAKASRGKGKGNPKKLRALKAKLARAKAKKRMRSLSDGPEADKLREEIDKLDREIDEALTEEGMVDRVAARVAKRKKKVARKTARKKKAVAATEMDATKKKKGKHAEIADLI